MRRSLALCALWLSSSTAMAHQQFVPTGTNRYLKVTLLGGGALRVAYTVMVGEVPALRARQTADVNHDGTVDAGEQAATARKLQEEVTAGLTVEVDGARRALQWEVPVAGFSTDTRVGPLAFSIDLVGRLDAGGGTHVLRLDDATPVADLAETEVRVEEGPGTRLLAGWQGREDGKQQSHWIFQGPKFSLLEDRSIGMRYVDSSVGKRRRPLPIALVAVLLAAIAGTFVMWRSRRGKKS